MGDETLRICRELVDEVVLCDTDEICVAIKDIFEDTRQIFFLGLLRSLPALCLN
jgi:threonine dehydratase